MKKFAKESKQASLSSKGAITGLLILLVATLLCAQRPIPDGVKFDVVSVRVLGDKEAADRSPDLVGPNIAVRLRLSANAHGLSFYGWKNSAVPTGYKVQLTDHGAVWFYGKGGAETKTSSPGFGAALFGSVGEWTTLPAHSAIEWEQLDSTSFAGEKHAFTAFVKQRDSDEAQEITSDAFYVPSSAASATH